MLQKVVIEHFRSCENVTIDNIGPSLVLVGPNGSGKTNILKAILWAAESALGNGLIDDILSNPETRAVSFDFRTGAEVFRYAISAPAERRYDPDSPFPALFLKELIFVLGPDGTWKEVVDRDGPELRLPGRNPLTVPPSTPCLPLLFAYLPADDPLLGLLGPAREFLGRIRYYPFDEPSESRETAGIITGTRYASWLAKRGELGRPEEDSVLMKLLHMWKDAREDFEEVEAILGPNGLGLIDTIEIVPHEVPNGRGSGVQEIYSLLFYPPRGDGAEAAGNANGSPRRFHYADLSHGTRRIIRMIVSMIFDQGSVMLIEHPEDGIHRHLTAKVFSTLRTYTDPSQIIVSSHSPLVFDMLDPEEVRLVAIHDGKTEVSALPAEEVGQARRYVKEQGSLSDYLEVRHDV